MALKALVCLVSPHGDAFELPELAEEVFDDVTPLVEVAVECQRLGASWVLRNDAFGTARIEVGDDRVAVKGLVSD